MIHRSQSSAVSIQGEGESEYILLDVQVIDIDGSHPEEGGVGFLAKQQDPLLELVLLGNKRAATQPGSTRQINLLN